MSDQLIIGILTVIASVVATYLTYRIAMWVNQKKVPAEIKQLSANSSLTTGELADKYLTIANRTADENIELAKKINIREELYIAEKNELIKEISGLRQDVKDLTDRVEQAEKDSELWKEYVQRLIYQLKSYEIFPVPLNPKEAKERGLPLGEYGNFKQDGTPK